LFNYSFNFLILSIKYNFLINPLIIHLLCSFWDTHTIIYLSETRPNSFSTSREYRFIITTYTPKKKNPSICHLSLEYILKKRNPLGAISKNKWHILKLRIQFFRCTDVHAQQACTIVYRIFLKCSQFISPNTGYSWTRGRLNDTYLSRPIFPKNNAT